MRIGIETGTSYTVVNGTKSFTITGLSGLLTKQSFRNVILQRLAGNIALINFAIDELELLTLTLNTGVYTVDYSALTRAASLPNLATGNVLAIELLVNGESITVVSKLDAIKAETALIKSGVDALGGLTVDYTHNKTAAGSFLAGATGTIKSYSANISTVYVNNVLSSVGSGVSVGDIVTIALSSAGAYTFVIKMDSISEAISTPITDAENLYTNIIASPINFSSYFGYVGLVLNGSNSSTSATRLDTGVLINSGFGLAYGGGSFLIDNNDFVYFSSATPNGIAKYTKLTGAITILTISSFACSGIFDYGDYVIAIAHTTAVRKISKTTFTVTSVSTGVTSVTVPTGLIVGDVLFQFSSSGSFLYVTDLLTMVTSTVATATVPITMTYYAGYLYVALTGTTSSTVYKCDPVTGAILATNAAISGLNTCRKIFGVGNYLYCCSQANNAFYKIDITGGLFNVVGGILSGVLNSGGLADPDNSNIVYIRTTTGDIVSYNLSTEVLLKSTNIAYGALPSIAIDNINKTLAIAKIGAYEVKVYKLSNLV